MISPDGNEINQITEKIIGCAYTVSNHLGSGFLEKIYENALAHEIRKTGLRVSQQYPIQVVYDKIIVGDYIADLLVEECVLVELKTVKSLEDIHIAQVINYLKAIGLTICLLFNFYGPRVETRRIVHNFQNQFVTSTPNPFISLSTSQTKRLSE
jgi:GxxExxY protein